MKQVKKILILLSIVFTAERSFAGSGNYKNEGNLGDVIKNQSISDENNSTSTINNDMDDDILRREAKTFLKDCGVEIGSGEKSNKEDYDRKGNRNYDTGRNRQNNGNFESNDPSWEENNNRKHNSHNYNRQMFNGKYKKSNNKNNNHHNQNGNNKRNKHSYNSHDENDESNEENENSNETEEDYDSSDKKYNREYGNKRNNNKDNINDDDENEGSSFQNQRNNKNKSNRNNLFGSYGGFTSGSRNNGDNNRSFGSYHSNSYSTSGYGSNNRNHGNYGNYDNNDQTCSSDRNKNTQYDGYDYYNSRGNGYDSRGVGSYNTNYDRRYSSYLQGKIRENEKDSILRTKRYADRNEEQCISQCVFGYLEVLDNNRVPSETLLIKWLQEHLGNDMKRIKSLREARRCFGRLSVIDAKDGCEFSKSLSNCLKLELE